MTERAVEINRYFSHKQRLLRGAAILGVAVTYGGVARPEPVEAADGNCPTAILVDGPANEKFDIVIKDARSNQELKEIITVAGVETPFQVNSNVIYDGRPGLDAYYFTRTHPEVMTRLATVCGVSGARLNVQNLLPAPTLLPTPVSTPRPIPTATRVAVAPTLGLVENKTSGGLTLEHRIAGDQSWAWWAVPLLGAGMLAAGLAVARGGGRVIIHETPVRSVVPAEVVREEPLAREARRRAEDDLQEARLREERATEELRRAEAVGDQDEITAARIRVEEAARERARLRNLLGPVEEAELAQAQREAVLARAEERVADQVSAEERAAEAARVRHQEQRERERRLRETQTRRHQVDFQVEESRRAAEEERLRAEELRREANELRRQVEETPTIEGGLRRPVPGSSDILFELPVRMRVRPIEVEYDVNVRSVPAASEEDIVEEEHRERRSQRGI